MPATMQHEILSSRALAGEIKVALEAIPNSGWPYDISMFNGASTQLTETYPLIGMPPRLREWVGGRQPKALRSSALTVTNKKWEATIEVALDDMRRDKFGLIKERLDEFAMAQEDHWLKLLSTLILNGAGEEYGLAHDNQFFFDTDHSEGNSGTQVNDVSVTQVPSLNVTTATAPTVAEWTDILFDLVIHMRTFLDDQGEPINEAAKEFLVMVPPSLSRNCATALSNGFIAISGGAVDNPLIKQDFKISVVTNIRLASWTDKFVMFRTDTAGKAFIMQEEEALSVKTKDENSDYAIDNDAVQFALKKICNVGFGYWPRALRATLS